MTIGETEYLEQRLDDQINWYSKKSASNQTAYKRLRLIEIIAASCIPLLAGYSQKSEYIGITIGVIGLLVAVIAGVVVVSIRFFRRLLSRLDRDVAGRTSRHHPR